MQTLKDILNKSFLSQLCWQMSMMSFPGWRKQHHVLIHVWISDVEMQLKKWSNDSRPHDFASSLCSLSGIQRNAGESWWARNTRPRGESTKKKTPNTEWKLKANWGLLRISLSWGSKQRKISTRCSVFHCQSQLRSFTSDFICPAGI